MLFGFSTKAITIFEIFLNKRVQNVKVNGFFFGLDRSKKKQYWARFCSIYKPMICGITTAMDVFWYSVQITKW